VSSISPETAEILITRLSELDRKVSALLSERAFDSKVPLDLRECAEVCHVELAWLRERVTFKEIPAYRNGDKGSWRVFPKDVRAFVMANSNLKPVRRKSVLRITV
jgi:hypothetical protein